MTTEDRLFIIRVAVADLLQGRHGSWELRNGHYHVPKTEIDKLKEAYDKS